MDHARRTTKSGSHSQPPSTRGAAKPHAGYVVALSFVLAVGIVGLTPFVSLLIPESIGAHARLATKLISALSVISGMAGLAWTILHPLTVRPRTRSARRTVFGSADDLDDQIPPLDVHTLVTISSSSKLQEPAGRFAAPGEIVLSSGRVGDAGSSIPIQHGTAPDLLPLRTQIDRVFLERLDEYKSLRSREGCVLLVTETMPKGLAAHGAPLLNGAMAALSLSRMIAAARDIPTLLIDAGSEAWSRGIEGQSDSEAPDVLAFPRVPGVYEIIAGNTEVDDWIILEDDLPSLMAMAPGRIPEDWFDQLRSEGMRRLIERARRLADVTVLYGPRCGDHPEIVRVLAESANGVLIVSGVDPASEAAEAKALTLLRAPGIVIFGRIALIESERGSTGLKDASKSEAVGSR
jgi:hypothetical protein